MTLESDFQAQLIRDLKVMIPGCQILKNDSGYQQGIPDLTIFDGPFWAWLEVKKSANERPEPNQPYFVNWAQNRAFGAFIFPENRDEVLLDLTEYLRVQWEALGN